MTTTADPRAAREAPSVVAHPWLATTVTIPAARCGPPGMGNGGWVSGTVAGHLGHGPTEVTLHAPTPLDQPLDLRAANDRASLSIGDDLLVSARRVDTPLRAPAPVSWGDALVGESRFPGHHDHPFPACFVCGPDRPVGDGLRLFTGPVDAEGRAPRRAAALYTPHPSHAGPGGRLGPAAAWALLDCPTAWVAYRPGAVALLGRLTGELRRPIQVGQPYLVVSELTAEEGRKTRSRVAVFDEALRVAAMGAAVWIRLADRP